MQHQHFTTWIFVCLILTILLTFLYPTPGMLFFSALSSSLLIFLQVFLVLTTGKPSQKTDEEWYDQL